MSTRFVIVLALLLLSACNRGSGAATGADGGFDWNLPTHFPMPSVPADDPMSAAKVELGRHLFYDKRLSQNGTMSCASCHVQELAFTDGRAHAVGVTGEQHPRGAMSLANVAYASRLGWANPLLERPEHQLLVPMFGEEPVEMGLAGREAQILATLREDARLEKLFAEAYPGDRDPFSVDHIAQAIASFERTLISGNSPYDRYVQGDAHALSESAKRGMELFYSERLECFHCHGGVTFSDSLQHDGLPQAEVAFHNTGLYNLDGKGAYPANNTGVRAISGDPEDMGRFKAPTLRNIAVTAPYMHDGSIATLEGVLQHYAEGGRTIESGPDAGVGSASPLKSEFVPGFILSDQETRDVIAFLESLTDETFLHDARFANPWRMPDVGAGPRQQVASANGVPAATEVAAKIGPPAQQR